MVEGEKKGHKDVLYVNYNRSNITGNKGNVKKKTTSLKWSHYVNPTSANEDFIPNLTSFNLSGNVTFNQSTWNFLLAPGDKL